MILLTARHTGFPIQFNKFIKIGIITNGNTTFKTIYLKCGYIIAGGQFVHFNDIHVILQMNVTQMNLKENIKQQQHICHIIFLLYPNVTFPSSVVTLLFCDVLLVHHLNSIRLMYYRDKRHVVQ